MSMTSDDKDHLMQDVGSAIMKLADERMLKDLANGVCLLAENLGPLSEQIDRTGRRLEDALLMIAKALRERNP